MADDTKRTNNVCTKLTDRMLIDLGRVCAIEDVTASDFMHRLLRRELYGRSMQVDSVVDRITSASSEG